MAGQERIKGGGERLGVFRSAARTGTEIIRSGTVQDRLARSVGAYRGGGARRLVHSAAAFSFFFGVALAAKSTLEPAGTEESSQVEQGIGSEVACIHGRGVPGWAWAPGVSGFPDAAVWPPSSSQCQGWTYHDPYWLATLQVEGEKKINKEET